MKFQAVQWLDSKGHASVWEHRDDLPALVPALCLSVGFVSEETRDYVTLVQTISAGQILGRISIPKCAIKKRMTIPIKADAAMIRQAAARG